MFECDQMQFATFLNSGPCSGFKYLQVKVITLSNPIYYDWKHKIMPFRKNASKSERGLTSYTDTYKKEITQNWTN